MPRKTLTVFAVTLLVALAAMGVAYGLWTETLYVNGAVHTGTLDVSVDSKTVHAAITFYDANGVAIASPSQSELNGVTCKGSVSTDGNTLSIVVDNAYPNWECSVSFGIRNDGTVPVRVHDIKKLDGPSWATSDSACQFGNGMQIDPGDTAGDCDIKIKFTTNDAVSFNQSYNFHFTVTADQWNEYR